MSLQLRSAQAYLTFCVYFGEGWVFYQVLSDDIESLHPRSTLLVLVIYFDRMQNKAKLNFSRIHFPYLRLLHPECFLRAVFPLLGLAFLNYVN